MKYTSDEGGNDLFFQNFTLDNDGATVSMAVNGSVTPQHFVLGNLMGNNQAMIVQSWAFGITDARNWDPGEFANLNAALSNGVRMVFWNTDTDSEFGDLTAQGNIINNQMFYKFFPTTRYDDWGGGTSEAFLTGNGVIAEIVGAPIILNPNRQLRIIVQDDLTGVTDFQMWAGGYYGIGLNGREGRK